MSHQIPVYGPKVQSSEDEVNLMRSRMNPIHERTPAEVVWKSLTMRTVGPLAFNDRLRALARVAASLWPGLAERLGLRPDLLAHLLQVVIVGRMLSWQR